MKSRKWNRIKELPKKKKREENNDENTNNKT